MGHLRFTFLHADQDVWFRPLKIATGEAYYKYVLLYIDDVLVISDCADKVLCNEIGQHFILREESIRPPSIYLGESSERLLLRMGSKLGHLALANMSNPLLRMLKNIL